MVLESQELWEARRQTEEPATTIYHLRRRVLEDGLAKIENKGGSRIELFLAIPKPSGDFELYSIESSEALSPDIEEKYPEIRTYRGQAVANPARTLRLERGPDGFRAEVRSPDELFYLEPSDVPDGYLVRVAPPVAADSPNP